MRDDSSPVDRGWLRTVRGYVLLPHLGPVLVVCLATVAFAAIAWGGAPPPRLLLPMLLAMLGGQLAIGATNELVDLPEDRVGKPSKPLPSGVVSIRGAQAIVAVGLVMMVVFGLPSGLPAFGLLALGTSCGLAYDLWFKRTIWSWLPYLVALPLLPIWVFAAIGRSEPRLLLLYPLGGLATIGVHFSQALPDTAIDREAGLLSPTSRLGGVLAFLLAWLATLSAPFLAWVAADRIGVPEPFVAIRAAAGIALLFLGINLVLIAGNRRAGVVACFPLVALATLASGLAWTATVAR